ncbi:MAG: type II toxin-antitoxin system PemK/MazF family toxin [Deltaproteobacteria bacterium]|nr:type II toxin-antitoxin system PemK/MazF family toxin [Deltaproteobacteria bacterium]
MIYKTFDIVSVPFPFTDLERTKKRPALVISSEKNFNSKIEHSVLAMITSLKNTPWPLDVVISNLQAAGLSAASVIRMKLFTLDHRLILSKIGILSSKDQNEFKKSLKALLIK